MTYGERSNISQTGTEGFWVIARPKRTNDSQTGLWLEQQGGTHARRRERNPLSICSQVSLSKKKKKPLCHLRHRVWKSPFLTPWQQNIKERLMHNSDNEGLRLSFFLTPYYSLRLLSGFQPLGFDKNNFQDLLWSSSWSFWQRSRGAEEPRRRGRRARPAPPAGAFKRWVRFASFSPAPQAAGLALSLCVTLRIAQRGLWFKRQPATRASNTREYLLWVSQPLQPQLMSYSHSVSTDSCRLRPLYYFCNHKFFIQLNILLCFPVSVL